MTQKNKIDELLDKLEKNLIPLNAPYSREYLRDLRVMIRRLQAQLTAAQAGIEHWRDISNKMADAMEEESESNMKEVDHWEAKYKAERRQKQLLVNTAYALEEQLKAEKENVVSLKRTIELLDSEVKGLDKELKAERANHYLYAVRYMCQADEVLETLLSILKGTKAENLIYDLQREMKQALPAPPEKEQGE